MSFAQNSEARIPNVETNTNFRMTKNAARFFRYSSFLIVSDFDIRHSTFWP